MQRQQGQTMVLGLLLCGLGAVALVHYFSVGQVLAERTTQMHALDTAAYSGAVVQARALNMLSLSNRAMVGHHLAMGHLVTLASWAQLGGYEAQQRLRGNPPAYLIAMLFGASHGAAYSAASGATGAHHRSLAQAQLGQAFARHEKLVHDTLATIQEQVVSTLPNVRERTVKAVLNRYYPGAGYQLTITAAPLEQFLHRKKGTSLHPFIQHVSSNYAFLQERNHTERNAWVVSARCPARRHELRRRGETTLDVSGRWQSSDTQSYHALRSNKWIGCYYREYAMGWGWLASRQTQSLAHSHIDNPPDNFSAQDFWRWVAESTNWDILTGHDNSLANSRAVGARQVWPSRGYAHYFDIKPQPHDRFSRLPFSVRIERTGHKGLRYTSHSAAETYFERPVARSDNKIELGNLFNPYWLARLASEGQ